MKESLYQEIIFGKQMDSRIFLMKKTDDKITIGNMMNVSINKTHILVKIMFASNLIWNLCIFGNEINSEYLGIPNKTFVLIKKYVVYVYDAVNCL